MISSTRTIGRLAIVQVANRLTHTGGLELLNDVRSLVRGEVDRILLDLTHVAYLDSAGIGAIVEAYTSTKNKGGHLKLLGMGPRIRHLFEITGLMNIFEAFDDEMTATASFAPPSGAARAAVAASGV